MPIDAMNGCSSVCRAKVAPGGMLRPISRSRSAFGFSSNATMCAVAIEAEDAHLRRGVRHRPAAPRW